MALVRRVLALLLLIAAGVAPPTYACGLEPTLNGGLTVSYPGALAVAVAVADSRRSGLLPPPDSDTVPNETLLGKVLTDLRRLQSQLDAPRAGEDSSSGGTFSLVLVGPSLWSHFHLTRSGVLARHHVEGPLDGRVVVLTHHAVLQALLNGDLSTDQATELGLIAYSGDDPAPIRSAFEAGFRSSS